jgi:hypothetical protein
MSIKLILVIVILICFCQIGYAQELIQAPLAIHISSTISDGKLTIPEIIGIAKQNNIKVLIITDRDLMRWEYGIWPLRNIIKKVVQEKSIFKYGIRRYLKQIERAQLSNTDLVLIPGQESAPFYYWEGSLFKDNFKMHDWHKHILAIGLDNIEDYKNLPIIGNPKGLRTKFQVYKLWSIILLLTGFFGFKKRKYKYRDSQGRPLGPFDKKWQVCSLFLITVALLFFVNNWSFYGIRYDQYHGNSGIMPYQNFIDYIEQHGGLTFWAHPEAQNLQRFYTIKIETRDCTSDLIRAHDYTGFAIFYEGYNKVGCPGGLWDDILKEYCLGIRKKPIWIIGGLSFDSAGDLSDRMKGLRNILLIPKLNKYEAMEALRKGRMYVMAGMHSSEFILDKFIIRDNSSGIEGTMGQEIALQGRPQLEIKGRLLNGESQPFNIKLIRNGKIIQTFEVISPFDISYQDEYIWKDRKIYYRIEAESKGIFLVTNPIFVTERL